MGSSLKLELKEGDSLEGANDTSMYNLHILPLNERLPFTDIGGRVHTPSLCLYNRVGLAF